MDNQKYQVKEIMYEIGEVIKKLLEHRGVMQYNLNQNANLLSI